MARFQRCGCQSSLCTSAGQKSPFWNSVDNYTSLVSKDCDPKDLFKPRRANFCCIQWRLRKHPKLRPIRCTVSRSSRSDGRFLAFGATTSTVRTTRSLLVALFETGKLTLCLCASVTFADEALIIELRKDDKTGMIEYYVHYEECTSTLWPERRGSFHCLTSRHQSLRPLVLQSRLNLPILARNGNTDCYLPLILWNM